MRYATITSWAEYFEKQEGIQIDNLTIRRRLNNAEKIGMRARDEAGRVLRNKFYSEADIRKACADLLENLPQADQEGFFEKEGIRYGMLYAWIRKLSISEPPLRKRFKRANITFIPGKDNRGHKTKFYAEPDVLSACADFLENLPQADQEGLFEKEGIRYGMLHAWSRKLSISDPPLRKRFKRSNIAFISGKDSGGRKTKFYAEPDVLSACADLLEALPQADENDFFEFNGIRYGISSAWARILSRSPGSIHNRLHKSTITSILGRDRHRRKTKFYAEPDVLSACKDLLEDFPQADETGFFELNNIPYGMLNSWVKILPISENTIRSRLEKLKIPFIAGRDSRGRNKDFYAESDVLFACADLLENLPQVDKAGFVKINGIRFGMVFSWSKILPISITTIKSRLKKCNTPSIPGKSNCCKRIELYPEPAVRSACVDLLAKPNPKAA